MSDEILPPAGVKTDLPPARGNPRQFLLIKDGDGNYHCQEIIDVVFIRDGVVNPIHVIEYKAVETLMRENDELKRRLEHISKTTPVRKGDWD